MRITLTIDDDMLNKAIELTGIEEIPTLINLGLKALIGECSKRLSELGGPKQNFALLEEGACGATNGPRKCLGGCFALKVW